MNISKIIDILTVIEGVALKNLYPLGNKDLDKIFHGVSCSPLVGLEVEESFGACF